jgi:hypothetical protein
VLSAATSSDGRTAQAVKRQVEAMGCLHFEVGLFNPDIEGNGPVMVPRIWDAETLLRSVAWLRRENRGGRNIFCRPKGEHNLSLVDDLSPTVVNQMKREGFEPALVVETSPNNFQVWLKHERILAPALSTAVAKAVADRFGGDGGAADWRHFGRLAGFTNRKLKHRDSATQLHPFVHVIENSGQKYSLAASFVDEVERTMKRNQEERALLQQSYGKTVTTPNSRLKTIDEFRSDVRYAGDGTRVDLAYAIYAVSHGVPVPEVDAAIRSRDLSHKGREKRQDDYVERTIKKALLVGQQSSFVRGR